MVASKRGTCPPTRASEGAARNFGSRSTARIRPSRQMAQAPRVGRNRRSRPAQWYRAFLEDAEGAERLLEVPTASRWADRAMTFCPPPTVRQGLGPYSPPEGMSGRGAPPARRLVHLLSFPASQQYGPWALPRSCRGAVGHLVGEACLKVYSTLGNSEPHREFRPAGVQPRWSPSSGSSQWLHRARVLGANDRGVCKSASPRVASGRYVRPAPPALWLHLHGRQGLCQVIGPALA